MAFLETPRLDPLITQGATSTSRWSVDRGRTKSGALTEQFNWDDELVLLQLEYRPRPLAEYNELRDYFKVKMANALRGFRAKDWSDYLLTLTNSTLTLEAGGSWQIRRVHSAGAYAYNKAIVKPISPVVIYRSSGGPASVATDAVIDYTTGLVALPGHVGGDTYTAVGEFDLPVTFVDDKWVSNFRATADNLWLSADPIALEEIRL